MSLLRRLAIVVAGAAAVRVHAQAAFCDHAQQVQGRGQAGIGCGPQVLGDLRLLFRRLGGVGQRQGVAEVALRAVGLGRTLVPLERLFGVAHALGAGCQDVAEQGLAVGGPALGGAAGPLLGRGEVRGGGVGVAGEQFPRARVGPGGLGRQTVQIERRQQGLGFDETLVCGAFQPARALRPADGDAGAFQVAASDAVFGFGYTGPRGTRQQREGALERALVRQAQAAPQGPFGRQRADEAVNRPHAGISAL